jgi:hypothetical protein
MTDDQMTRVASWNLTDSAILETPVFETAPARVTMAEICKRPAARRGRGTASVGVGEGPRVSAGGSPAQKTPRSAGVLTAVETCRILRSAFDEVDPGDLREWLVDRRNFRCRRFQMPHLGECWLDFSLLTRKAGLGLFSCGEAAVGLAVHPAWGHHGLEHCSLCEGGGHQEYSSTAATGSHTFCPRCVYEITGDASHIVANLLFFANHTIVARSNGRFSTRRHDLAPVVSLKQTSPCHPEFLMHYNGSAPPCTSIKTDPKICAVHPGGPRIMKTKVTHPTWRMCRTCYARLRRLVQRRLGVCPTCDSRQVRVGPACDPCRLKFDRFVHRRSLAELGVVLGS